MAPAPGNSSVWVTSLTGESRAHKAQDTSSAARRELALQPPSCLPRPMFWRGTTGASPGGLGRVCCRATCDSGPNPVPWVCPLRRRKMHRKQPAVNPSPTPGRDPTETRGPLQRVSRAGGSPAAGGGVGGAGWARGAAPVRMDGCEGGVQPGCWGRGAQTASGPHTQGLSSGSSRRRRWVFRPLTALSACQAPGKQASGHGLLSSAFTLAMSKSLLLSHSIPRNAHVLWPSSCTGEPSSSSMTSLPSASCSPAGRPAKLLSGDSAGVPSACSDWALLAARGDGRASPSSSVPGAM